MEYLVGTVIFILDIWAIVDILGSSKTTGMKVVWTFVVLLFPLVGLLLYVLLGRSHTIPSVR